MAHAQNDDPAAAESLFVAGKKLLEQKNYALACPKLAESYRIDSGTGTLLGLALCHEGEGRLATAWGEFAEVAARSRREGRPDREDLARGHMSALASRLSVLTVSLAPGGEKVDGLEIKRDGVLMGAGSWATPVPVDPGHHHVEAAAPGYKPFSITVGVVGDGDKRTVIVPVLELDHEAVDARLGERPGSGLSTLQAAGIAVGGAGVVGVVVGSIFGVRAIGLNNDSKRGCDAQSFCDVPSAQKRNDARSTGDVSTAAFVVGGALLAGGAAMVLWGKPRSNAAAILRAAPVVTGREVGFRVEGAF